MKAVIIAASLLVAPLAASPAQGQMGDPATGLDITISQIPGGQIKTTKTDSTGYFVFDRLAPGTYVLRPGPLNPGLAKAENYNSSKSNTATSVSRAGTELHTVNIEVSQKVLPGKDPGIRITIRNRGGRIDGRVTMVAIKKEDAVK